MKTTNICPNCHAFEISRFTKAFSFKPFHICCSKCGAHLRVKLLLWQNVVLQILGQIVFGGGLLFGLINDGIQGLVIGGGAGIVLAVVLVGVAVSFAPLEVLSKSHEVARRFEL